MKRISPYTAAAVLILSRLYAYALYIPAEGEYAGVTALGCLLMNMIKLVLLIPLIFVCKAKSSEQKEYHTNRPAALLMGGSAFAALTAAGLGFWTLCRSVYPDRLSSIGVPVIWFAACAYIASMGMGSISRSAGFMVFAFTGVILLTFIGMRHNMLSDRVYIYSDNYPRELSSVLLRQSTALYDIPLLYGLLPYTRQSTGKSVGIYLTFDTVISMIVFFMYAAVLGDFKSRAGYSIFTLFSCTQGTMIDRADGIFIAITCACGLVTCSALILVLCDCIKSFTGKKEDLRYITVISGAAALLMLGLKGV